MTKSATLGTTLIASVALGVAAFAGAPDRAQEAIARWPEEPRKIAAEMIEKYGQPTGVTPDRLIWTRFEGEDQPWTEIILRREKIEHHFPMPHNDYLEQVISYQVPADKFDELAEYDGSVIAERTRGTLSARCDKEAANYLALNLAHDIVTGNMTVEQARQFYADAIRKFKAGETPRYMRELTFEPQPNAGDPDEAVITPAK